MSTTAIAPRITTESPIAALLTSDGYKLSHAKSYPAAGSGLGDSTGTTRILLNWTNRGNKYLPGSEHAVVFGVQAFAQEQLTEAWAPFFAATADEVCALYEADLLAYLGPNNIGSDHIRALHNLGYLPLKIKALPEGTLAPMGIATVTVENTHDAFFWLPNYIETALSASIWHPGTVATIALEFRELMEEWAIKTGGDLAGVDFQGHDFSMRGQTSVASAGASGAGHLLSFLGSDSLPSIDFVRRYYPGDNGWVAASVPATEHSVMCIRGEQGELETFNQILDAFPTGIVSAVSDGYDFFKVITEVLPKLHKRIMGRDGKLVIRPDSGDPVDIITGTLHGAERALTAKLRELTPEEKGLAVLLDEQFGHTVNCNGYRELDPHVGMIYGDSISLRNAPEMFARLEALGYASTNIVLGIGSYSYQLITRDSLASACKSTFAVVNGFDVNIQKDPKTGSGKKSAKGRIVVFRNAAGELEQYDEATESQVENESLLETVWENGVFVKHQSFADVRAVLKSERAARAARRAANA
jgi:nicotinamide phosphoribosyltransferase